MKGFCQGIAQWCRKNAVVSKEEYPILIYGLQTIFNSSVKIAVILLNPVLDSKILCRNRICGILECVCLLGATITSHNTKMGWLVLIPLFVDGVLLLPWEAGEGCKCL